MGIYRGLGVVNDGLVFGYDTGYPISDNTTNNRFNQGQPATNLFTVLGSPSNVDENVTFSVNGTGTFKRVAVGTEIGDYKVNNVDVVYSYALGVNGCHYHGNDYSSVSSGTKVSLSVEYFLSPDVGSFDTNYLGNFEQLSGVSGSWGTVSSTKGVWHKVTLTRTATATGNLRMLMYPGACGNNRLSATGTIYYKNPTVTLTDQPVPFVNGTRSDTASLIDLKRTTSIDVGDVSFDSNAQPEFDGTDDILNTGLFSGRNPSTDVFTIEAIVKSDTTSGNHMWVDATGNGSNQRLYCAHASAGTGTPMGIQNSGWSHSIPQDTNYHHYVITMNGSTAELWNNGTAHSNKGYTSYTLAGQINVGGRSGYRWVGKIPVFKIYDTVLTETEIKQNYNAYKNRFNI
jgi:hypothetical protein